VETKKLEEENELLKKELFRIKQQLIMAELKNGGMFVNEGI